MKQLACLSLIATDVTDNGLDHLEPLKSLKSLDLQNTQVTAEGIAKLKDALPHCNITWDGNAADDTTTDE